MPCHNHDHKSWPKSGKHRLRIEACETHCGWCEYSTGHANNLRVHVRRHIANPSNDTLRDIVLVAGKAGRSRVALHSGRELLPQANTETQSPPPLLELYSPTDHESTRVAWKGEAITNPLNSGLLVDRIIQLEQLLHQHGLEVPRRNTYLNRILAPASPSPRRPLSPSPSPHRPLNPPHSLPMLLGIGAQDHSTSQRSPPDKEVGEDVPTNNPEDLVRILNSNPLSYADFRGLSSL